MASSVTPGDTVCPSPQYLKRKEALAPKTLVLECGRTLSYIDDGPADGVPVLAIHGGCSGKEVFLFDEPIPGVRLLSIDRPGYGGSTDVDWREPQPYLIRDAIMDVQEFIKHLQLDAIIVIGWSSGAMWALQTAAALPQRVRACIALASRCDIHHTQATDQLKEAAAQGESYPRMSLFDGACEGAWSRGSFLGCCFACTWDWGATLLMFMGNRTTAEALSPGILDMLRKDVSPERFEELHTSFWVSAVADASTSGFRNGDAMWLDCHHVLEKWPYDVAKIECPVFIYHGNQDKTIVLAEAEFNAKIIPKATLIQVDDNHLSISQRAKESILQALAKCT